MSLLHSQRDGAPGRVQGWGQEEKELCRPTWKMSKLRMNTCFPAAWVSPYAQDRWFGSKTPSTLALFLFETSSCLRLRGYKKDKAVASSPHFTEPRSLVPAHTCAPAPNRSSSSSSQQPQVGAQDPGLGRCLTM